MDSEITAARKKFARWRSNRNPKYSIMLIEDIPMGEASSSTADVKPFVQKLHALVSDATTSSIVDWTSDGSALAVLEVEPFVSSLLPNYFKHSNLSSFVRQLNTYGFSKVDAASWIFKHPDFHRDHPERLHLIQRKSSHRAGGGGGGEHDALILQPVRGAASGVPGGGSEPPSVEQEMQAMVQRIHELDGQVKEARMQQATTRASIGQIMQFLSQVYNQHQTNFDLSDGSAGTSGSKRMRLGGGGVDVADLPPPASSGVVQPPFSVDVRPEHGSGAPSLEPPTLSRGASLGSQVARALSTPLREVALERLLPSTELQDQAIQEVLNGRQSSSSSSLDDAADLTAYMCGTPDHHHTHISTCARPARDEVIP